jgi:hypothetical protein
MFSPVAMAGDQADAEAAIAVAKGKLAAGDKVGTNLRAPQLQEQARQALREAQDLLDHHHKEEAKAAAIHAGELADQALIAGENRRTAAERDRRIDTQQDVLTARQSAATANLRATSAEVAGNAANLRAKTAEQEADEANARLHDAAMAPPAPQTTTMTMTEHETTAQPAPRKVTRHKVVRHKVVHHKVLRKAVVRNGKTTTTVITTSHP